MGMMKHCLNLRRGMNNVQLRFLSNNRFSVLHHQGATRFSQKDFWLLSLAMFSTVGTLIFSSSPTQLEMPPVSGDVIFLGAIKEKSTGILFPKLCNGFTLAGTGVRVKYGFVKVYAVGTYLDPLAMSFIKGQSKEDIEKALLDPMYPRTIRIVMARNLSIQKFTDALSESLKPRMNGEDLQVLDEFAKLNQGVDLVQGAEMELTIRGDTLLFKNAVGGIGRIQSAVFTKALCDVYYGKDAVSQAHRDAVIDGIKQL